MRRRSARWALRASGQAAVETAIVMPLFIFLILGLIQLGLMHQARVLTKYAAFKAVRVGSIHNAKQSAMKRAAQAVLLPVTGRRTQDSFFNATPAKFHDSWASAKERLEEKVPDALLRLTICDPVGPNQITDDFDDPKGEMGPEAGSEKDPGEKWKQHNRGRLSIQLTNYYQLVIPFANGVIFYILAAKERAELYNLLRMRPEGDQRHKEWLATRIAANGHSRTITQFEDLAETGVYVVPIRAGWSMRMQSNFLNRTDTDDFKLPPRNLCRVPWEVHGSDKGVD